MSILNAILRVVVDAALYPFRDLNPLVGLTLFSLVFGILALLLFKWTSDQVKLDQVKRRIHAGLFEIRLFNDDLRAIFRAMFQILRHNLTYMRLALVPLLWMIVLFGPIFAQMQFHYGYQGFQPGGKTLVKMELTGDWEGKRPEIRLEVPSGLRIAAGPVWVPSLKELSWRVVAEDGGDYELAFQVEGETVTKTFHVANNVSRRSPVRPSSFLDQLLYPAEPPIPSSVPISRISFNYPHANGGIEGLEWEGTWVLVFLVISMVFALALRKPLGVTI